MLYVNELLKRVASQPILVLQPNFMELIAPTPESQYIALEVLLAQALEEYEKFDLWDQKRVIVLRNYAYEFNNEIGISDQDTYPIPEQIVYLKSGSGVINNLNPWLMGSGSAAKLESDYNSSMSARLWQYHKPILEAQYTGSVLLRTISHRPYVFHRTNDNKFSEDSRIWELDISNINFFNVVYRAVLIHIKTLRESVTLQNSVQFLMNIDDEINRLSNIINTYIRTNCKGMNMWRK